MCYVDRMIAKLLTPAVVFSGCCAVIIESLDDELFTRLKTLEIREVIFQTDLLVSIVAAIFAGLSVYVTIIEGRKPIIDPKLIRSGFKQSDKHLSELREHMQELQRFVGFSFLDEDTLKSANDDQVYWTRICHSLIETDYIYFYNSFPDSKYFEEAVQRADSLNLWSRTDKTDPYSINSFIRTGPFMLLRMESERELQNSKLGYHERKRKRNLALVDQHNGAAVLLPSVIIVGFGSVKFFGLARKNIDYSAMAEITQTRTIAGITISPQDWGINLSSLATFCNILLSTLVFFLIIFLLVKILRYLNEEVLVPELNKSFTSYENELNQRFMEIV